MKTSTRPILGSVLEVITSPAERPHAVGNLGLRA